MLSVAILVTSLLNRLEEQKKQEEFEKELDIMYKRVESRKFLFEQADEVCFYSIERRFQFLLIQFACNRKMQKKPLRKNSVKH